MTNGSPLLSDDTVIILAQALTGLGHLRVSHALYHGLPREASVLLLSSQDESINYMHKITSINPFLRRVMEFVQNGWAEDVYVWFTRQYFRNNTKLLGRQLQTILSQRIIQPKTLLVVATHTNLAHQLAAIKESFGRKNNIRVVLVVVVTDDSPQHIWAVGGADFIVVPSESTKRTLEAYHTHQSGMPQSRYIVLPYMVSPGLSTHVSPIQFRHRREETDPAGKRDIHVAIPVSGAAVQLTYLEKLIKFLTQASARYAFHIVSHQSRSTRQFLARMTGNPNVTVSVSISHREVVELYEQLYERETIALEVTKPSEQAFKILVTPRQRGGAILLFSSPVGRQEHDNLAFLLRHGLIPSLADQEALWKLADESKSVAPETILAARRWRGMLLPPHSLASAKFISWCLQEKIFAAMMDFQGYVKHSELASDGVAQFWRTVDHYLRGINPVFRQERG